MMDRVTNRLDLHAASARAHLRVILGPDKGLDVDLPRAGAVVGSASPADIILSDRGVSRRHCSIRPSGDGFEIVDLDSKNGTYVDRQAIKRGPVPAGTVLRVGDSLLQLLPSEGETLVAPSERASFGGLVGSSAAMRGAYAVLERAATSSAPVLLLGESGTGKELCARAIHDRGERKDAPFVVFDCGATAENLIESDLFGHVKGAFTGANTDRPGAFERAHKGTLFLDEIGELPIRLQPKLLRMLESGEVTRVGGRASAKFDVRIVAATHRDLRVAVDQGTFRGDLYYRLAVLEVLLPPLRKRPEDLPRLIEHFLKRERAPSTVKSCANLEKMARYAWPGNVRELRNVIVRAVTLSPKGAEFSDLSILLDPSARAADAPVSKEAWEDLGYHDAKARVLEEFERVYIPNLLERHKGNFAEAARRAGIERRHLYRMLDRLGLDRRAFEKK